MNRHIPGSWQYEYFRQILDELDQEARSVLCVNACKGFTNEELEGVNLNSKFTAMKKQRDELLQALQYWLPKELPFPNQSNDPVCQKHNKQWNYAQKIIAKAGGNIPPSSQTSTQTPDSKSILTENMKYE